MRFAGATWAIFGLFPLISSLAYARPSPEPATKPANSKETYQFVRGNVTQESGLVFNAYVTVRATWPGAVDVDCQGQVDNNEGFKSIAVTRTWNMTCTPNTVTAQIWKNDDGTWLVFAPNGHEVAQTPFAWYAWQDDKSGWKQYSSMPLLIYTFAGPASCPSDPTVKFDDSLVQNSRARLRYRRDEDGTLHLIE